MKFLKLILIFLCIQTQFLNAESFYISEIFANALKNSRDSEAQWLEITNISAQPIFVNTLKVEIFYEHGEPQVFESIINSPLVFKDRLIIAHKSDLGFARCLSNKILVVSLGLVIKREKKINICISLNKEEAVCTSLKALRFPDAVSLFRTHEGSHTSPLWQSEPCLLENTVFATPGLAERVCAHDKNFAAAIFAECTEKDSSFKSTKRSLMHTGASKPDIKSLSLNSQEHTIKLNFSDKDSDDLWRVSLCKVPPKSTLICHKIGEDALVDAEKDNYIKIPDKINNNISLELRDMYGLSTIKNIEDKKEIAQEDRASHIRAKIISNKNNNIIISLELKKSQVPLNTQVLDPRGVVLLQRAFLKAGTHKLLVNTSIKYINLGLSYEHDNLLINLKK